MYAVPTYYLNRSKAQLQAKRETIARRERYRSASIARDVFKGDDDFLARLEQKLFKTQP